MAENLINRAHILIQQNRFDEAGTVLRDLLSIEPDNVFVLAMLAEVNLQQEKTDNAEQLINSAIGLSPDTGYLYFVKARVCLQKNRFDDAEKNLQEAINLNPEEPDFFALWASVKQTRKQYPSALELANEALKRDSEHILGLNIRSSALLKLNRKEDSFQTIEGALAHDPNNAYTHANYGWGLLEKGDHRKALVHFREALKNNPNLEHAQAGMAEASKAKYWFYRLFLQYAFFMNKLASKYQLAVIVGFFLAFQLLQTLAKRNELLRPYLTPVILIISLIAFSTWVITPVSNLMLRLNPYGQYLLTKDEKLSANFVGVSLLLCLTGVLLFLFTGTEGWLVVAIFGFAMMVPLGSMLGAGSHRKKLIAFSIVMSVFGILAILFAFQNGQAFNVFTTIFMVAFIGYQWVSNLAAIRRSDI